MIHTGMWKTDPALPWRSERLMRGQLDLISAADPLPKNTIKMKIPQRLSCISVDGTEGAAVFSWRSVVVMDG